MREPEINSNVSKVVERITLDCNRTPKLDLIAAFFILPLLGAVSAGVLQAQTGDGRPQEYIESSSPLPGGGVVTTVVQPGSIGPAVTITGGVPQGTLQGTGGVNEASVLVRESQPATGAPRVAQVPPAGQGVANTQPTLNSVPQFAGPVQQPVAGTWQQVPVLGMPVAWDRSLSPARTSGCGCLGFGRGSQVNYNQPVFAPAPLAGVQPPPATYSPTQAGPGVQQLTPTVPFVPAQQQGTWTPLVRLQNLPSGAHIGQGIIGSPKAYVDGQPFRNLLRYLIIP